MSDVVTDYYQTRVEIEWNRLDRYRMEFDITKRVLAKYLPKAPSSICDIGGGPGRYSFYLANNGYNVTLVDIADGNIKFAKEKANQEGVKLDACIVANAVDLHVLGDGEFDAVLLMGPMYHLTHEEDQRNALSEAQRILKPNGVIITSFVTRYERLRFIAEYDPSYLTRNKQIIYELLDNGAMFESTKLIDGKESFTEAYFAHPEQVTGIMDSNGFNQIELRGIEVITGKPYDKSTHLTNAIWKDWVDLAYYLGTKEHLLGSADHLLYIGRKKQK